MIKTVLVAGAGIVGMSTAIWLQRYGYRVTLVDQAGPASGTSYGNAGVLAAGSVIPVTTPGLLTKAPGMLLRSSQPLFMRPSYLPKLVPFLSKYLAHANRAHVERYAAAMSHLLYDTVEQHRSLSLSGWGKYCFEPVSPKICSEDCLHGCVFFRVVCCTPILRAAQSLRLYQGPQQPP